MMQTITIERSNSTNKRLKQPLTFEVPATTDKVALDIQKYVIDSLSSRAPRLIPFALRYQSLQRLAEYFKYERSASQNSPSQYIYGIHRFCVWASVEPDDLIAECKEPEGIMIMSALPKAAQRLERYYKELMAGGYAPHSVSEWIAQIKSFYKINGVEVPFSRNLSNRVVARDRAPTPEELQRVIDIAADIREKTIVSMLALGGFREGTLVALKYRHVKTDLESGVVPVHVHVEAEITKGKYGDYDTFIGKEAVEYLKAYLALRRKGSPDGKIPPETITDESPLIRNRHIRIVKPLVPRHVYKCVHNLYYRAGLLSEKSHRRYSLRVHSIRKFFRTQLSALGVNTDIVEYFMGHVQSTYMDIQMKGIEFLRNVYAASGISIRPKTQQNKIEVLKEMVRVWGMNPEEVLTKEALSRPFAATNFGEEEQAKSLSMALKEMMRKELLNGKQP